MTEPYTPPTEDVRDYFAYGCGPEHTWDESRVSFDRWFLQEIEFQISVSTEKTCD